MSHMRLWAASGIILVALIIGFVLTVPHAREVSKTFTPAVATTTMPAVTLHDAYRRGTHTITGSIMAPDACSVVTATTTLMTVGTTTTGIALDVSMPSDVGICLQLPTKMDFSTKIDAPADLPITVTVNGASATTSPS